MIASFLADTFLKRSLRFTGRVALLGTIGATLVLNGCKDRASESPVAPGLSVPITLGADQRYQAAIENSDLELARSILDRDADVISEARGTSTSALYQDLGKRLVAEGQFKRALSIFEKRAAAGDDLAAIWLDALSVRGADEAARAEFLATQSIDILADLSEQNWTRLATRLDALDIFAPFEEPLDLLVARALISVAQSGARTLAEAVKDLERASGRLVLMADNGSTEAATALKTIPAAQNAIRLNLIYFPALKLYQDKNYSESAKLLRQGQKHLPFNAQLQQLYGQALFGQGVSPDLRSDAKSEFLKEARNVFASLDAVESPSALTWLEVVDRAIRNDIVAPTIEEGRQLFVAGNYEGAIPVFEQALGLDPDSLQAKRFLAQSLVLYARSVSGSIASTALDRADIILEELAEIGSGLNAYEGIARTQRERLALAPILMPAQEAYDAQQYAEAISLLEDARKTHKSQLIEQLYIQSMILRAAQPDISRSAAEVLFDRAEQLLRSRANSDDPVTKVWLDVLADRRATLALNIELDDVKRLYASQDYAGALELLEPLEEKYSNNLVLLDLKLKVLTGEGSEVSLRDAARIIAEAELAKSGSGDRWVAIFTRAAKPFLFEEWIGDVLARDTSSRLMMEFGGEMLSGRALAREKVLGYRWVFRAAQSEGFEASRVMSDLDVTGRNGADCTIALAVYTAEARELTRLGGKAEDAPICPLGGNAAKVQAVLTSAYSIVGEISKLGGLMDLFDPSIDRAGLAGIRVVPPQYDKPFSIVSDADSQTVEDLVTLIGYMQDVLGLPIPTSIFIAANIDYGGRAISKRIAALSNSSESLNGNMIDAPVAFNVVRNWHSGRADHLHGWSDARTVAQHYFVDPMSDVSAYETDLSLG